MTLALTGHVMVPLAEAGNVMVTNAGAGHIKVIQACVGHIMAVIFGCLEEWLLALIFGISDQVRIVTIPLFVYIEPFNRWPRLNGAAGEYHDWYVPST